MQTSTTIKLNNGLQMPIVGLGTYKSKPGEIEQAVKDAIDCGYSHFDCAWFYGNEEEIGKALKDKINEGKVKREELFITSKLLNICQAKDEVFPMLIESLKLLQLTYIDFYLVHWPYAFEEDVSLWPINDGKAAYSDIDYLETWQGMEECVDLGIAKSIGVSDFNQEQFQRLVNVAKIQPVINQVECHPTMNLKPLITFCKQFNIFLTASCPLGRTETAELPGFLESTLYDPEVIEMAKKYNKTPAQIVLRYLISLGVTVTPKCVSKSRIQESIDVFNFVLHDEDVAYLDLFHDQ